MYQIKLDKKLYNYLMSILKDEVIKENISLIVDAEVVTIKLDADTKLDLMEYVEDKQLEIGFINQDYLNEDGKKLQDIYDELYYQTN
jgi:hypothetical protein